MKRYLFDLLKTARQMNWLMLSLALVLFACMAFGEPAPEETDGSKEPTCTESGYRLIEKEGITQLEQIPATGHRFSEWVVDKEGKTKTHQCEVCGYTETIRISSVSEDLFPRLDMTGNMEGIGKKTKVVMNVRYTGPDQTFECYGLLTFQGHSTYEFPKKNYTIRFYDDAEGTQKHRVVFRNWDSEHKYVLKANYLDQSQCRNLVGAGIWADMVKTRTGIPDRLARLTAYGAVDGFPIAVYLNGTFHGLYTLNLHKDDDLYQMKKGEREAVVICNTQTTDESLFREKAAFDSEYSSDWEIEFCGTEDDTWAKESFNRLISFVMESSDEEFREELDKYLDTEAAADYLLFIYALGLKNSGAKDLIMLSYGDRWIPSAYDMEEAFGLDTTNSEYMNPAEFLPAYTKEGWTSGTGSLMWDRFLNAFYEPIRERYHSLRQGPLAKEHVKKRVNDFIAQIPESFYDLDFYLYPNRPFFEIQTEEQIVQYIEERLNILDKVF